MTLTRNRTLLAAALLLAVRPAGAEPVPGPGPVSSPAPPDERTSLLRELVVGEGETAAEATCFACGVVVRGRVLGDTVAILGSVEVAGSAGRGGGDDVTAIGGSVHVGARGRVPASILSLGGRVRTEPGAALSAIVDSFPWFPVPGQPEPTPEGASCLVALVLVGVLAGGALVRPRGIAMRDEALARRPAARTLIGLVVLAALMGALAVAGDRLHGRLEDVVQVALGLGLIAALTLGSTGLASLLGRGVARLAGRRLAPGWGAAALGALALAVACLVPLLGAAVALAALVLACGGCLVRRVTLPARPDEVSR